MPAGAPAPSEAKGSELRLSDAYVDTRQATSMARDAHAQRERAACLTVAAGPEQALHRADRDGAGASGAAGHHRGLPLGDLCFLHHAGRASRCVRARARAPAAISNPRQVNRGQDAFAYLRTLFYNGEALDKFEFLARWHRLSLEEKCAKVGTVRAVFRAWVP